MSEHSEADLYLLNHLGRYLGVLAVEYVLRDEQGNGKGWPQMLTCSGFFIVLDDQWYFVTAGHVFHRTGETIGLKQAVDTKAIRVTKAFLADYFGPDAKPHSSGANATHLPTIVDIDEILSKVRFVNDDLRGLDFAFVPLRPFYVSGVTANGVKPLTELQWQTDSNAALYVVVGFPDEEKTPSSIDASDEAAVRPCFARMNRCDLPDYLQKPTLPYLALKLPDDGPISPVGFSGSPIFAIKVDAEKGRTYYWLVAIDYKWHKEERIIVGCLITTVVEEFRKLRDTK